MNQQPETTESNVEFVATMINDCGTADELASVAYLLKNVATHLNDNEIMACYAVVRQKVITYAGIPDNFEQYVDAAIESHL
jgi:hypothetical protein